MIRQVTEKSKSRIACYRWVSTGLRCALILTVCQIAEPRLGLFSLALGQTTTNSYQNAINSPSSSGIPYYNPTTGPITLSPQTTVRGQSGFGQYPNGQFQNPNGQYQNGQYQNGQAVNGLPNDGGWTPSPQPGGSSSSTQGVGQSGTVNRYEPSQAGETLPLFSPNNGSVQSAPNSGVPGYGYAPTPNFAPYEADPGSFAAGQPVQGGYGATVAPGVYGGQPSIAPGSLGYASDPLAGLSVPDISGPGVYQPRVRVAPLDVYLQEARTGRVILGGSVNSDLGVAGQLIIDERNFDFRAIPRSWSEMFSGYAFRGAGQSFRAELMPGNQVERYTVNWTNPNMLGYLPYSLSVGGFLFSRIYEDWTERRLGGRIGLGYAVTKDLTIGTQVRGENVRISNPRINGVPALDDVLGKNELYTARFNITRDTRDSPFLATEGSMLELIYDQAFGKFDYPQGQVNFSHYNRVHERADGMGRHVLVNTWRLGFSGSETPIFENFYAGGFSTMRGFRFRGASPTENGVQVGGRFMFLGSLEYMFPLTADEMLRGVAFVDYGTIEQDITINSENFRVAPGLGLRISVPMLGPAPLAFDFAVPVAKADGDRTQLLSFYMGFTR